MKTNKKESLSKNKSSIKMYSVVFMAFLFYSNYMVGQSQCYDNFEGAKHLHYAEKSGVLDTVAINPALNDINSSKTCALYVRNRTKKFDNIKMSFPGKLSAVDNYATYLGIPPQLSMKIYTSAPVGTLIEILLGSKGRNNEYPAGTNSQYQAYTTVSNAWEVVQFKFSQIPKGSETSTNEVDQLTLLFNPNSLSSDTYYFDEINGPILASDKLETESSKVKSTKKTK